MHFLRHHQLGKLMTIFPALMQITNANTDSIYTLCLKLDPKYLPLPFDPLLNYYKTQESPTLLFNHNLHQDSIQPQANLFPFILFNSKPEFLKLTHTAL